MFTSDKYAQIVYTDETMREGMQIEDAGIPVADKIALLDKLSQTGLDRIMVGSFVSAKYTPQMRHIEEIVTGFKPKPGVIYTALALNARGLERASEFMPPLSNEQSRRRPRLYCHMCDIFVRRNANKGQADEMATWKPTIEKAKANGATEATIGLNAIFGSNYAGDFSVDLGMKMFGLQHALWDEAGITVKQIILSDPMGWNHPVKVTEYFTRIQKQWPQITDFTLHVHNTRGMAMASIYAALQVLRPTDTLRLEGTVGGIGGCPYCGNGVATNMVPTEDLVHMLEGMGYKTGVSIAKLIECHDLVEKMIGRATLSHVPKTGPRPTDPEDFYDANMPFVETLAHAQHFREGPSAYEGAISPWKEPVKSPYSERIAKGLPVYELNGSWPWDEPWVPRPEAEESSAPTQHTSHEST
jgi:hydroxymethylglutaryl-CoA lyase